MAGNRFLNQRGHDFDNLLAFFIGQGSVLLGFRFPVHRFQFFGTFRFRLIQQGFQRIAGCCGRIDPIDSRHDVFFIRHHDVHIHLGLELHNIDNPDIRRIHHRNRQRLVGHKKRDDFISTADIFGNQVVDFRIDIEIRQFDIGDFKLGGKDFHQPFFGHKSQGHQRPSKPLTRFFLFFQCLVQLGFRDEAVLQEHFADTHPSRIAQLHAQNIRQDFFADHPQAHKDFRKRNFCPLVFAQRVFQLIFVNDSLTQQEFANFFSRSHKPPDFNVVLTIRHPFPF